ncbi:hypothetical protein JTB14_036995 [Gonioctena quinquepunctata]|nr:hypothetical protein JTB14_036995 [Gonioctena quinquepunctata]
MAEHMSNLHISSESASYKESEAGRMQRLYMCEEMRKFKTDSILPQCLLSRLQQPCTALVLWKPPTKLVPPMDPENDENENNNAKSTLDHNTINEPVEIDFDNEISTSCMDMDNC